MKPFDSLSLRLTLQYTVIFMVSMLLLGGLQYWRTLHEPLDRVKQRVELEAQQLSTLYREAGHDALVRQLMVREEAGGARLPFHAYVAADGQVVAANLPEWPAHHGADWLRLDADRRIEDEDQDHEALLRDVLLPDGARLLVGRDIEDIDELEEKLLSVLLGIVASAVLLGMMGGMLMSRVIGRQIARVARTAGRVMQGDLSERIPLRGTGDDFDKLNATLNEMLARIEQLVEMVRRVSDSVAHELRTPLARLRLQLETLQKEGTTPTRDQIDRIGTEIEKLMQTFDAVLRISRIESGRHGAATALVELETLLADAVELYQPEAQARQQQLRLAATPGSGIAGDRDLIFQAVCNLLDNAIKYTPEGGQIEVALLRGSDGVEIRITDSGTGIPAAHVARVTERFYRVPATAGTHGAGLGLSLVAAVAERHASTLHFEHADPGLRVRWLFAPR